MREHILLAHMEMREDILLEHLRLVALHWRVDLRCRERVPCWVNMVARVGVGRGEAGTARRRRQRTDRRRRRRIWRRRRRRRRGRRRRRKGKAAAIC
jgi:hypothetical protein